MDGDTILSETNDVFWWSGATNHRYWRYHGNIRLSCCINTKWEFWDLTKKCGHRMANAKGIKWGFYGTIWGRSNKKSNMAGDSPNEGLWWENHQTKGGGFHCHVWWTEAMGIIIPNVDDFCFFFPCYNFDGRVWLRQIGMPWWWGYRTWAPVLCCWIAEGRMGFGPANLRIFYITKGGEKHVNKCKKCKPWVSPDILSHTRPVPQWHKLWICARKSGL